MRCRQCQRDSVQGRRGLCWDCLRPERQALPRCRHCHIQPANLHRQLCCRCYHTPGIRERYPSTSKFARCGVRDYTSTRPPPASPTSAPPASRQKIAVLEERARLGVDLWHPLDAPQDTESIQISAARRGVAI